jgi:hypothetical protein
MRVLLDRLQASRLANSRGVLPEQNVTFYER